MSLRLRLLLAAGTVAFIALAIADLVTYSALRSSLYARIDSDLQSSLMTSGRADGAPGADDPAGLAGSQGAAQYGSQTGAQQGQAPVGGGGAFVATRSVSGKITVRSYATEPGGKTYEPDLPLDLTAALTTTARNKVTEFTTQCTVSGGPKFRVAVSASPDGSLRIVALPLDTTTATLHQLLYIEAGVTGAALAVALALGWWLVRVGLRPLVQMESTAEAIAEGALEARVPGDDRKTEVGHLAATINVMLARIQRAFGEREATEVELRASEERLRRFVADASHELRTPLAAVSAYAELFARGAGDRPADLDRVMRGIRGESARMGRLVEDLLQLARLDEHPPVEHQPLELVELASEAAQAAALVGPRWPVVLEANSTVEILGDRGRLRQVIDNLLANVRAHTPEGTTTVVRLRTEADRAVIEVVDNGPGLTPEQAARVFDRFYRADVSRSRETGGTGLGLSIVAAIVESHGGRVAAAPGPSGGAVFTVLLPATGFMGVDEVAHSLS